MNESVLNQRYELCNPPCIEETIAGDAVVINLDSGKYYNLTGDAGKVWSLLLAGVSVNELVSAFAKQNLNQPYSYNEAVLENKLCELISTLLRESMIRPRHIVPVSASVTSIIDFEIDLVNPNFYVNVYEDMQELLALDPIHEADDAIGWPKAQEV